MAIRWRTTDRGTVGIHWLGVILLGILATTGLKLLADEPQYRWLAGVAAIVSGDDVWFWHIVFGYVFSGLSLCYAVYVVRARLGRRIGLDMARLKSIRQNGATRWSVVNVLSYYLFFGAALVCVFTGLALSAGFDVGLLAWHIVGFWIVVGFPFVHIVLHIRLGGIGQLLRIFRPVPLARTPEQASLEDIIRQLLSERHGLENHTAVAEPATTHRPSLLGRPLVAALLSMATLIFACFGIDRLLGKPLHVAAIGDDAAPILDGDMADAAWSKATPVVLKAGHGGDFGGRGETTMEIRAVHDHRNVYFAIKWRDPTRSLQAKPLRKENGRWRLVADATEPSTQSDLDGDRLALMIAPSGRALLGSAIHLGEAPLADGPKSASGRGLHFTAPGSMLDLWQWSPVADAVAGHADDGFIGPPLPFDQAQQAGIEPYNGGLTGDKWPGVSEPNVARSVVAGAFVLPKRLPAQPSKQQELARELDLDPTHSGSIDEMRRWGMTESASLPYSKFLDARIANGAVLPGVVVNNLSADSASKIASAGHWASGEWFVELRRSIAAEDEHDLNIQDGNLVWLAAFDHSPTRHTYHLRPMILEID